MSGLAAALASLVARLTAHHAQFALVGGLAESVRTEPRFTRDADVCVAVEDDHAAEELLKVLASDDRERPQDRVVRVALLRAAIATDVSEASALVRMIGQRGYDRGKDLIAELDRLQDELGLAG